MKKMSETKINTPPRWTLERGMKNELIPCTAKLTGRLTQWAGQEGINCLLNATTPAKGGVQAPQPLTRGGLLDIIEGAKPLEIETPVAMPQAKLAPPPKDAANPEKVDRACILAAQSRLSQVMAEKKLPREFHAEAWDFVVKTGFEVFKKMPEGMRKLILSGTAIHPASIKPATPPPKPPVK
jgi:hypothetical protein